MSTDLETHPLSSSAPARRPPANRLPVVLAVVAVVGGALLLFSGYWGASGTSNPGEQLPYFASGTIPGLALVICGLALLLAREHRRDRDEVAALAARLDALIAWLADLPPEPAPDPGPGPGSGSGSEATDEAGDP